MAKATYDHTTPPTYGGPSIFQLARLHAELQAAHEHQEKLELESTDRDVIARAKVTQSLFEDRVEHLKGVILTMRPATIQDVVVQLHFAAQIAGTLTTCILRPFVVDQHQETVERVLLGSIAFVADAAKVDVEAMGWSEDAHLAAFRYGAVEAVQ